MMDLDEWEADGNGWLSSIWHLGGVGAPTTAHLYRSISGLLLIAIDFEAEAVFFETADASICHLVTTTAVLFGPDMSVGGRPLYGRDITVGTCGQSYACSSW
jgi:hypothetical protein